MLLKLVLKNAIVFTNFQWGTFHLDEKWHFPTSGPWLNCCKQAESLIDDTESLFDLKRIVVRSLILLVCGRKEVCTCLYALQVEINGYLLLGSAGDGCSGPFSDDAISVLITSDCY